MPPANGPAAGVRAGDRADQTASRNASQHPQRGTHAAILALAEGGLRGQPADVGALLEEAYHGGLRAWVHHYMLERGCRSHDLDDLMQEVFRRVLLSRNRYRGHCEGEFWAYLSGICRSVLGHAWRKRDRESAVQAGEFIDDLPSESREGSPDQADENMARRSELEQGLAELTPTQRTVVLLRYRSGLSLRAVAEVLGRAPSTVAETEQAGLRRLARHFAGNQPDDPALFVEGAVKSALFRRGNTRAREDRKKTKSGR